MKQGDFSRYVSTATPFTGLTNPFTGGSYGTQIPTINSASAALLKLYPDPNVGDPAAYSDDGIANYIVYKDSSAHSDQFDIRGDQYFGSNQKFFWGRSDSPGKIFQRTLPSRCSFLPRKTRISRVFLRLEQITRLLRGLEEPWSEDS